MNINQAAEAKTIDLLRRIHPEAWAEITEPSGWTYYTNIGLLAHRAADELQQLQADGAGEERLQAAAREWIAYHDKHGAREFNRRFGTKEVHGDEFIKFLREFLQQGSASNPSKPADIEN